MPTNHTKIIYALIALLFVALGFTLYQNQILRMGARTVASPNALGVGAGLPNASTTPSLADIVVGGGSTTTTAGSAIGTIAQIGSNSMQIKDQNTGKTYEVSITPATKIQLAGAVKDPATIQTQLAAYNAQVAVLMKDPVKNKAALAAMQVPSVQDVTPLTLADLKIGDLVMVVASSITSGNVYVAASISKSVN